MSALFKVGDRVTAVAIPDGFPAPRGAVNGLIVKSVRRIDGTRGHWRVHAVNTLDYAKIISVEGAEHNFVLEGGAK